MAFTHTIADPADASNVYELAHAGQGVGTCSTNGSASLVVTMSGYNAVPTGYVAVKFAYSVVANATMNINGKGAYPIKKDGAAIGNNVIAGGTTQMFYFDGSAYNLLFLGTVIDDSNFVHKTGDEDIAGEKVFYDTFYVGDPDGEDGAVAVFNPDSFESNINGSLEVGDALSVGGNASVDGTLGVTGITTLQNVTTRNINIDSSYRLGFYRPANTDYLTIYLQNQGNSVLQIENSGIEANAAILRGLKDPVNSNDAATKNYVDNNVDGAYRMSGVAGFNGLFDNSLCMLDHTGRMSSFTTTGGTGTKTVYTADDYHYFPMASCGIMRYNGKSTNGGSSFSDSSFASRGVIDVRYIALRGNNLPSTWANVGDPVYLSVRVIGGIGIPSPALYPHPAPFPTPISGNPLTFPDVPRDIIISKKMLEDYNTYLISDQEEIPEYGYPYKTMGQESSMWGGYVYLGKMISTYDLQLEENNPLLAYNTFTNGNEIHHYFLDFSTYLYFYLYPPQESK